MKDTYTIWYMKPEHFPKGIMGALPEPDLSSHKEVIKRRCDNRHSSTERMLNSIYAVQQAEQWSPNGEARPLIESLGLQHISMSVGDLIEHDGRYWMVDWIGFKEVTNHIKG